MDRNHEDDWGVMCSVGKEYILKALYGRDLEYCVLLSCSNENVDNPETGDIRLYQQYGGNGASGRVEVFLSGTWISVIGDLWTTANSLVACQQLGYLTNGECNNYNA